MTTTAKLALGLLLAAGLTSITHARGSAGAVTSAQLDQAAGNPSAIAALLESRTPEQAADVVRAVILRILVLHDTDGAFDQGGAGRAAVNDLLRHALGAMPADQIEAFAAALGAACGRSMLVSSRPAVLSAVQGALATAGGVDAGATLADAFATAFLGVAGPQGIVGARQQVQTQAPPPYVPVTTPPPPPPPPPVATRYRAQQ